MTILDFILVLFFAFLLIKGLMKGLVKELSGILAVSLAVFASFAFYDSAANLLSSFIGPEYLSLVAYASLFILVYLGIMLLGNIIDKLVKSIMLGGFNRVLGGVFGLLKATLWSSLFVFAYQKLEEGVGFEQPGIVKDSLIYPFLVDIAAILENAL